VGCEYEITQVKIMSNQEKQVRTIMSQIFNSIPIVQYERMVKDLVELLDKPRTEKELYELGKCPTCGADTTDWILSEEKKEMHPNWGLRPESVE
jgi:hypothetical protein